MQKRVFSPSQPYNGLPLLPPDFRGESPSTLKAVIRARAELSELKADARLLPNPSMLVRAIVMQEAKMSSEIENIVTTNDELYRAMTFDSVSDDPQTKEVLRYGEAVWHGVAELRHGDRITPESIERIASKVNGRPSPIRSGSGTRIGIPGTGQTIYTPPEGTQLLRKLLENLCDYLVTDDDVDPLIKLATSHYQFEAIHPFRDGNGRTGRILNVLLLIQSGLLESPIVYLSGSLIRQRPLYYRRLREVTERADWEAWIIFMIGAIEEGARETRTRVTSIRQAMGAAAELLKRKAPALATREMVELIFSQPYVRISSVEAAGIAKRQTASEYLKRLENLGILTSRRIWRDTIYINDALMRALTE